MMLELATHVRILSLLFLLPLVQAQSCYVAAGVQAASHIVPCGNSGVSACCQLGDICLEDSACYNYETEVTYSYGCTDSSYSDPVCPWKCGPDYTSAPYVGLTYCGLDGGNIWTCTNPPSNNDTVESQPGQECTDSSQVAFAAGSVIPPILSLPSTVGGSTGYYSTIDSTSFTEIAGYTPAQIPVNVIASQPTASQRVVPVTTTTTPSQTTPSRTTPSQTTTTTTPPRTTSTTPAATTTPTTVVVVTTPSFTTSTTSSATSSTTSPASSTTPSSISTSSTTSGSSSTPTTTAAAVPSSSLSTGEKAGIGVGVALGVLLLAGLGFLILFLVRKRRRSHEPVPQEVPYVPQTEPKTQYMDQPPVIPPVAVIGDRSELYGDEPARHPGKNMNTQSEVDSYSRFAASASPAPTYATWESSPRPQKNSVHEIGVNF